MARILITSSDESHESYRRTFKRVEKVLEDKPVTWSSHEHMKGGLNHILAMEVAEYKDIKEKGNHAEIIEGLTHVAAAAIYAINRMTCD